MKKKKEWVTKAVKRNARNKDRGILDLVWVMNHFFKELPQWIDEMSDPRNQSYITYTQSDLVFMGLLKNVCGVKTMHQMEERFNEEACISTLRYIGGDSGLAEMPHSDTLNYYLSKLSPDCLSGVRQRMIKSLIRGKDFYGGRLQDRYWRVILDGTGLFRFKERHCENCLVETRTGAEGKKVKLYYHKVLEAKIVLSDRLVLSLGTEFIENEREDVSKQDCELNAAKRLLARIKGEYPRLRICLQADNLYEVEPVMRLCRENKWHYIFTHKGSRQRILDENFSSRAAGIKC